MSVLSDGSIWKAVDDGSLGIDPFDPEKLQPASYDLTLGHQFKLLKPRLGVVDPERPETYSEGCYDVVECAGMTIAPGQFVLAHTVEHLRVALNVQATVCGKSSLGRLGLFVENAGFIDPCFEGQLTLELYNCSSRPILLRAGMRIAQVSFNLLDLPARRRYGEVQLGSHYQGQLGAVVSRGSF